MEARKSNKSKQSVELQQWSETQAKVYKDFTQKKRVISKGEIKKKGEKGT